MKSIAILSLDNHDIQNDSRVLRQIKYLSRVYPIDVISYGRENSPLPYPVQSLSIVGSLSTVTSERRIKTLALLSLGKIWPTRFYEAWYWNRPGHLQALEILLQKDVGVIHANDWWTLPVAVKAAKRNGAKVILDLHEYALDEFDDLFWWRFFYKPVVRYFIDKYLPSVDASVTVGQIIAERYQRECKLKPVIVMNAPDLIPAIGFRATNPEQIRLIQHGVAEKGRFLETLIDSVAASDQRYTLTFMIFGDDQYIKFLKKYARQKDPERIFFVQRVPPAQVLSKLGEYDIGVYLLGTQRFNNLAALPNKFFDFVSAGLAVCIGPSPEMARLIKEYGFGRVSQSFRAGDLAAVLNSLNSDEIDDMKHHALEARKYLNADIELAKLLDLYTKVYPS